MLARFFVDQALTNPANRAILERLPGLSLPDAWLVAGCLFQTCWNLRSGRPPADGIRDYDVFYFDASDLSPEAEERVGQRVQAACADLGVAVEVKNQARVHTWYEAYFGAPYSPLRNVMEGIDRFLVDGTCVGLQARIDGLSLMHPMDSTLCCKACCAPAAAAPIHGCMPPRPTTTSGAGPG